MSNFYQFIRDFLKKEDGPTAVEYAVMLALIIVVCIAAIGTVGTNAREIFLDASLRDALETQGGTS